MITASGAVVIRGPEPILRAMTEALGAIVDSWNLTANIGISLSGRRDGYYLIIGSPDALVDELVALKGGR
jgi:hypothetical protein